MVNYINHELMQYVEKDSGSAEVSLHNVPIIQIYLVAHLAV